MGTLPCSLQMRLYSLYQGTLFSSVESPSTCRPTAPQDTTARVPMRAALAVGDVEARLRAPAIP